MSERQRERGGGKGKVSQRVRRKRGGEQEGENEKKIIDRKDSEHFLCITEHIAIKTWISHFTTYKIKHEKVEDSSGVGVFKDAREEWLQPVDRGHTRLRRVQR